MPRPPGVYSTTAEEDRQRPMAVEPTGIPGFVGVAERGPTNEPVRITSLKAFHEVYGALGGDVFLETAVAGFFENGGRSCYVLRVAHLVARHREERARAAFLRVADDQDRPTLAIRAANEGVWGNRIRVSVERQPPRVSALLTLDLNPGDTSAVIKSTHGIRRGTVVRISDGARSAYRTVTELSGKTLSWDQDQPLDEAFASGAPTLIEPVEFTIEARWGQEVERFANLNLSRISDQNVVRVISEQSRLLQVEDLSDDGRPGDRYPVTVENAYLEAGADGLFSVTPEDFMGANIGPEERYGLAALEAVEDVDLLVAPDLMWALEHSSGFHTESDVQVVQNAMISQCERLKNRFALLDLPDPEDHRRASQWRLLFDTAYAAFYYPWLQIEHRGELRLVPPSGHMAGIIARCDKEMGPYRAPANEELTDVVDLARNLREADIGRLNDEGINCFKYFTRRGIRIWGARTASSDPQWRYVNVRRIVSTIIKSVERGLQWSAFETNTPYLWKSLTRQVTMFLLELWQQGYFKGGKPEEAFYVKCDYETNPKALRDAGIVVMECGVAPVRPAEFLVFRVSAETQLDGGAT